MSPQLLRAHCEPALKDKGPAHTGENPATVSALFSELLRHLPLEQSAVTVPA